jgi:hypothetical protein
MTIKQLARWGLVASLIGAGVVAWLSPNYEEAQAATDRQTVDCMVKQLSQDDKRSIAQFADINDFNSLWRVYDRVFPDCTVRGDQRDRKSELVTSAWRVLSTDREFMRLREANAGHAALGH